MIELISLIWIFFGTLIGQAIIICVGYTFLFFFPKSKEFPSLQKFAISYGLGIGLLVFSMFLFILIGIHSRISFIPLLIISSILFLYFKIYKNLKDDLNIIFNTIRNWITRQRKINNVEIFCLILLIVTFLFLLYNCITLPFFADDPLGFWNPKALYIFFDGNFNYINYNINHADYPPLIPLILVFYYSIYGQPHYFVQLNFFFNLLYLLLFLYYSLRRIDLSKTYSILIITMVGLITDAFLYSFQIGGDLILTYYYLMSTMFLTLYIISKKRENLIYASIFLGFMAITKQEGLGLAIVNIFVFILYLFFSLIKRKEYIVTSLKLLLILVSLFILIEIPWQIFALSNNLKSEYDIQITELLHIPNLVIRIIIILIAIILQILWSPFWILFLILTVLSFKAILKDEILFFSFILCIFHILLYIGIYIITPHDLIFQLVTSITREFLHLAPFAGFVFGLLLINNNKFQLEFKNEKE